MSNNIVKHGQLEDIARDLWNKAKARDIEALTYNPTTKTITATNSGTNAGTNALSIPVRLTNLVSVDERAEFKKDVSVDDAKTVSNSNVGDVNGPVSAGSRTTGYRGLTSKLFTDGYVKLLRIYLPADAGNTIDAHVWMIKKGASKTEDKFLDKKVQNATVVTSGANKYIDVEIERKFEKETFFVLRTVGSQQIQGIRNIKSGFTEDIINVDDNFNPTTVDELTNWNNYRPNTEFVGHMELHGRTGIADISKRLDEIGTASGNYVLQSETTTTSEANKVVKLGRDGKINPDMIPEIAINRVLTATSKENALTMIGDGENKLQVGDVVVLSEVGNAAYMYKGRAAGRNDDQFDRDFLELTLGTGTIKNINGATPNPQGSIVMTKKTTNTNTISLSFGTGGTDVELFSYMSEQEVRDIKDLFV